MLNDDCNSELPLVMHVDLNSAFATIEQQSRPLLRGKPVAVVNRRAVNTAVVTASYEAKARGIKVGMRLRDAKLMVPQLIALESDPMKYRFVYRKLLKILSDYSPNSVMKSIDEGVIDFHGVPLDRSLRDIGLEIKDRLKTEIGVAMRCNVGIGTNRFLAKMGASLHKPDGLDIITSDNLRQVYSSLELTDLTGIANRMQRRLRSVGIDTPLDFLDSSVEALEKVVFKSIVGRQWHQRLRGYEVDDYFSDVKRVGRQYVLESRDLRRFEITARLHNLCESVGARMRRQGKAARGVYVYARTAAGGYWHACGVRQLPFFSDSAINAQAQALFLACPEDIREIGVHCYELADDQDKQLSLFGDTLARERRVSGAIDAINARFGDRTIHVADTLDTGEFLNPKISFGSTRYF
jgi:DNA polymerase IV